jgi:hypothetical protein
LSLPGVGAANAFTPPPGCGILGSCPRGAFLPLCMDANS